MFLPRKNAPKFLWVFNAKPEKGFISNFLFGNFRLLKISLYTYCNGAFSYSMPFSQKKQSFTLWNFGYRPFHKTLPRFSQILDLILVRFNETSCMCTNAGQYTIKIFWIFCGKSFIFTSI